MTPAARLRLAELHAALIEDLDTEWVAFTFGALTIVLFRAMNDEPPGPSRDGLISLAKRISAAVKSGDYGAAAPGLHEELGEYLARQAGGACA